ncbi:MAG: ABC transporter permease [Parvularculaceae bacterium]
MSTEILRETTKATTTRTPAYGVRRFGVMNWLGLWTLYKKEVLRFLKVAFQTVLAPIISTLLFLLVFMGAWGASGREVSIGGASIAFFTFLPPGLVMMGVISNAFQNASSSLIIGKVQGTIVDVLMPPLSPLELTIAYVLGAATRGLLVGFVTLLTVVAFTWVSAPMQIVHLWAVLYFSIMAAIMLGAIGAIAGMWAEKFDQLAMIANFLITPLSFLSGTFYSIHAENMPSWLPLFSSVNPLFYVIDGFRYGFIGVADGVPVVGAIITFFLTSLFCLITYFLFRSGYKLKS